MSAWMAGIGAGLDSFGGNAVDHFKEQGKQEARTRELASEREHQSARDELEFKRQQRLEAIKAEKDRYQPVNARDGRYGYTSGSFDKRTGKFSPNNAGLIPAGGSGAGGAGGGTGAGGAGGAVTTTESKATREQGTTEKGTKNPTRYADIAKKLFGLHDGRHDSKMSKGTDFPDIVKPPETDTETPVWNGATNEYAMVPKSARDDFVASRKMSPQEEARLSPAERKRMRASLIEFYKATGKYDDGDVEQVNGVSTPAERAANGVEPQDERNPGGNGMKGLLTKGGIFAGRLGANVSDAINGVPPGQGNPPQALEAPADGGVPSLNLTAPGAGEPVPGLGGAPFPAAETPPSTLPPASPDAAPQAPAPTPAELEQRRKDAGYNSADTAIAGVNAAGEMIDSAVETRNALVGGAVRGGFRAARGVVDVVAEQAPKVVDFADGFQRRLYEATHGPGAANDYEIAQTVDYATQDPTTLANIHPDAVQKNVQHIAAMMGDGSPEVLSKRIHYLIQVLKVEGLPQPLRNRINKLIEMNTKVPTR